MAYTPQLTDQQSCTLRRIAWALNAPMTRTMSMIMDHMANTLDPAKVCAGCRDRTRCASCTFAQRRK